MMIKTPIITVIFNNISYTSDLASAWGFAVWIQTSQGAFLFDTGSDGEILMNNIRHFHLTPAELKAVIISHHHWDHTGGLKCLLKEVPVEIPVYVPDSARDQIAEQLPDALLTGVSKPVEVASGLQLSGIISGSHREQNIDEQSLFIQTDSGLVIITGCAHPGVDNIVEQAHNKFPNDEILLLTGGFHMADQTEASIDAIIQRLKDFQVQQVAPSHCTGDHVIDRFRREWKDDFLDLSLGRIYSLP